MTESKTTPTRAQIACAHICAAFDLMPSFAAKQKAMEIIEAAMLQSFEAGRKFENDNR